ncbi:hypothetical protein F2Q69_00019723 [Brassica cretica]|uniref:Uncharacterized protein n=1 Tax=Brassica cretica TaxID=69181 RepID=A0A8S9PZ28_BRACR|nr:hypothetical protein F2Q69_00019723 [Brassica cretica]
MISFSSPVHDQSGSSCLYSCFLLLHVNGSRLKSSLSARDMDMVMQLQSPSRHSQMNHYLSTPVRLQIFCP